MEPFYIANFNFIPKLLSYRFSKLTFIQGIVVIIPLFINVAEAKIIKKSLVLK